jgi:hypothetical protein
VIVTTGILKEMEMAKEKNVAEVDTGEADTGAETTAGATGFVGKRKFAAVRSVTESVFKMKPNQARFIFLGTPMFLGKKVSADKPAGILCRGLDMETGERSLLFCGAVLSGELFDQYGGVKAEYVGKGFEVVMTRQRDVSASEKSAQTAYNHYSITEVEVPDEVRKAAGKFEAPTREAIAEANKALEAAAKKKRILAGEAA